MVYFQKLTQRKTGVHTLEGMDKVQAMQLLTPDYISSDEDEEEERVVRNLTWESPRTRLLKEKMDAAFYTQSTLKQRRRMIKPCRKTDGPVSNRAKPTDAPEWAVY